MFDLEELAPPLAKTIAVLRKATGPQAVATLMAALDVADERIRVVAIMALMNHRSTRARTDLIRKWESLSADMRAVLASHVQEMGPAIRQCLQHGDTLHRVNALDFIRETENYEQVPLLLDKLAATDHALCDIIAQTLFDLINSLYARLQTDTHGDPTGSAARSRTARGHVLAHLADACGHLDRLAEPEIVVELALILAELGDTNLNRILRQSGPECRRLVGELLLTSRHPGVMQLVCDFMNKPYPHPNALKAMSERDDLEFICHVLRQFPEQRTKTERANYRQIESIRWLEPPATLVNLIPPGLHAALAQYVAATGVPLDVRLSLQEWLVRNGSPEGRLAASEVLSSLDDLDVQAILNDSLESDDPNVQAWATMQLRAQNIPNAFALLVQRLNSPIPAVREAAQNELSDFNLECILGQFDHFDDEVCQRAAELLQRTDPDCVSKLRLEFSTTVRWKRIRAARAAQSLGLAHAVADLLISLMRDHQAQVRRTAAEVLGTVNTPEAITALQQALDDPNPQVREAAIHGLRRLQAIALSAANAIDPSPMTLE